MRRAALLMAATYIAGALSMGVVSGASQVMVLQPGQEITIRAAALPSGAPSDPPSASTPACSVAFDSKLGWVNTVTGLTPGVSYGVWWTVSHTDGGDPYYTGSSNALTASPTGRLRFVYDPGYPGFGEAYVFEGLLPDFVTHIAECGWIEQ